jgi:pimeloyl-ACP methyl ester carboxylesterase
MGAANSISFSATYPEMVNSLVLVDFAPAVNPAGREAIAGL